MRKNILAIAFILCVFGLLVLNRVYVGPQGEVRVARDTGTSYSIGQTFLRGETVRTGQGEFLEIAFGDSVRISLDENSNLHLKSFSTNALRVGFGHGRILVVSEDRSEIEVDTPTAKNKLESFQEEARATFIGYDFKKMTSVIPLAGLIKTTIPLLNQTFEVASPITIHDVNPPTVEEIVFDEKSDARKEFYVWAEGK